MENLETLSAGPANFWTSSTTDLLDVQLAKAVSEFPTVEKNKLNPHFKSKFADINGVIASIKQVLTKYEIMATQWLVHGDDDRLHIITRVAHKGQYIMAKFSAPVSKKDAQGFGSASTYLRRYALMSALCIAADEHEDDDGNAAVGIESKLHSTGMVKVTNEPQKVESESNVEGATIAERMKLGALKDRVTRLANRLPAEEKSKALAWLKDSRSYADLERFQLKIDEKIKQVEQK